MLSASILKTARERPCAKAGGTVLWLARAPLGTSDYSSFLVQAQSSGADVLGLANAGGDLTTSIKQAAEFGLTPAMKLAGPVVNINVVHGVRACRFEGPLERHAVLLGHERRYAGLLRKNTRNSTRNT